MIEYSFLDYWDKYFHTLPKSAGDFLTDQSNLKKVLFAYTQYADFLPRSLRNLLGNSQQYVNSVYGMDVNDWEELSIQYIEDYDYETELAETDYDEPPEDFDD